MTAISITNQARPKIEPAQYVRNGKAPDAEFQATLAEHVGMAAAYRGNLVFRRSVPVTNLPNSASGTRERWRSAFHTGPFCKTLSVWMQLAQQNNGSATNPYGLLQVLDVSGTVVGVAKIYYGATTSATDTPNNFGGGGTPLVSPSNDQLEVDLTPDTEYTLVVSDVDYARVFAVAVWEMGLQPDTDNGYPDTGTTDGTPIFDADRQVVTEALAALWNRGGRKLWDWTSETDATAPSTSSTSLSGSLTSSFGSFTISATGTVSTSAPTFVSATDMQSAVSSSLTVSWPTHQSGDIAVLLVGAANNTVTLSDAQGFASKASTARTSADYMSITAFWCRATSGSMSAPTIANAGVYTVATMLVFRGCVASGDPFDAYNYVPPNTNSAQPYLWVSTVTTSVNNCLVLTGAIVGTDTAVAGDPSYVSWTETERTDSYTDFSGEVTYYRGISAATTVKATAGVVSGFTGAVSPDQYSNSVILALKP